MCNIRGHLTPYDHETSIRGQWSSSKSHWHVTPLFKATGESNTMMQSEQTYMLLANDYGLLHLIAKNTHIYK